MHASAENLLPGRQSFSSIRQCSFQYLESLGLTAPVATRRGDSASVGPAFRPEQPSDDGAKPLVRGALAVVEGRWHSTSQPGTGFQSRRVAVVCAAVQPVLLIVGLSILSGCNSGHELAHTTVTRQIVAPGATADSIPLTRAPKWMGGYCHKAADDLGYAVLCPRRLPRVLDIIPCRGPAPAEKLWGKYCFDYVLDSLFSGPPGYHGPFATNRRTGHLALWTIGPKSDFYPDGLFACPGGGRREGPELVAGHSGYWWACPETAAANVNSGHIAFQWSIGDVVLGASVHGITARNKEIVRELLFRAELVGPGV